MKKEKGICSKFFICLYIIILLIIVSCFVALLIIKKYPFEDNNKSNNQINLEDKNNIKEIKLNFDYIEYENKNKQIYFKYPKEFTQIEVSKYNEPFYFMAVNPSTENYVSILIYELKSEQTIDEYIETYINNLIKYSYCSKEDIKKEATKLGNADAFDIQHVSEYKDKTRNIYQRIAINNNNIYVISYMQEDTDFKDSKANEIFDTFRFTDNEIQKYENN